MRKFLSQSARLSGKQISTIPIECILQHSFLFSLDLLPHDLYLLLTVLVPLLLLWAPALPDHPSLFLAVQVHVLRLCFSCDCLLFLSLGLS